MFDLVYALSVFTHLPESPQLAWRDELLRVLKTGGYLLFSTHGEATLEALSPQERARFDAGELVVKFKEVASTNLCNTYHPLPYLRIKLAAGWEFIDFIHAGARGNPYQDLVLLRKPAE
jgi:hypothetical protein